MNMTRKNLMDLLPGEVFCLDTAHGANYVCEGAGTIGNLTRVTYSLRNSDDSRPREYTFTKVNLTSVYVFSF